ncbi:MAG: Fe-S-binding domain-containing protein, partial [Acidobacteria bacterium]|nr:Fe-S-binding domain-containing protein [Acidobacteriota bacterium]
MSFFMENILTIVCFFPLLGVVLIVLWPRREGQEDAVRWIANIVAFIGFLISLPLITLFNDAQYIEADSGMRFVIRANWIDAIGAQYSFGIDGISMLLILLTTLLGFISILSSWSAIT